MSERERERGNKVEERENYGVVERWCVRDRETEKMILHERDRDYV